MEFVKRAEQTGTAGLCQGRAEGPAAQPGSAHCCNRFDDLQGGDEVVSLPSHASQDPQVHHPQLQQTRGERCQTQARMTVKRSSTCLPAPTGCGRQCHSTPMSQRRPPYSKGRLGLHARTRSSTAGHRLPAIQQERRPHCGRRTWASWARWWGVVPRAAATACQALASGSGGRGSPSGRKHSSAACLLGLAVCRQPRRMPAPSSCKHELFAGSAKISLVLLCHVQPRDAGQRPSLRQQAVWHWSMH